MPPSQHAFQGTRSSPGAHGSAGPQATCPAVHFLPAAAPSQARPGLCSPHLPSSVPFFSHLCHLLLPPRLTCASGVRTDGLVPERSQPLCQHVPQAWSQADAASLHHAVPTELLLQSAFRTQHQVGPLACPQHWARRRGRRGFACRFRESKRASLGLSSSWKNPCDYSDILILPCKMPEVARDLLAKF